MLFFSTSSTGCQAGVSSKAGTEQEPKCKKEQVFMDN